MSPTVIKRTQTGVRIESSLLKVLKGLFKPLRTTATPCHHVRCIGFYDQKRRHSVLPTKACMN